MPSEITASVGKPAPLPKRPTLYAIVKISGGHWLVLGNGQYQPTLLPGEALVTIPGDDISPECPITAAQIIHKRNMRIAELEAQLSAPPPARDKVREAAEAVLKQYDVAWSISWLDNLKVSIVALRTALATKGPAK